MKMKSEEHIMLFGKRVSAPYDPDKSLGSFNSASTTLFLLDREEKSTKFQESDCATEIPSSDDVDTTLSLSTIRTTVVASVPNNITDHGDEVLISLAKFRKEIIDNSSFLGLGCDKTDSHDGDSATKPENIIDLAKFHMEVIDKWSFLVLGIDRSGSNHKIVLNPTPLRSYHPKYNCMDSDRTDGNQSGITNTVTTDQAPGSSSMNCPGKKRKSSTNTKQDNNNNNVKKKGRIIKLFISEENYPEPIVPSPELVQRIGTTLIRPLVFLYTKKLEDSDIKQHHNRLMVNKSEKLMDFLTDEERIVVEDKAGIDLIGVDTTGREYKLRCTRWESLHKVVFNREWYKMVDANGAKKGDLVHLWGYRKEGKFGLAVEFHHRD